MSVEFDLAIAVDDDPGWRDAMRWAGAFIASFKSPETRTPATPQRGCADRTAMTLLSRGATATS